MKFYIERITEFMEIGLPIDKAMNIIDLEDKLVQDRIQERLKRYEN